MSDSKSEKVYQETDKESEGQPQQHRKGKNPQAGLLPVVEPERYEEQLQEKLELVKETFSQFGVPEPQIHRSAPKNYRNRAEFRIWHDYEENSCYCIMFEKDPDTKEMNRVRMDLYPVGTVLVNELMKCVIEEVNKEEVLKNKLYQVNFHTTQSGDAMVTMIYHKELKKPWINAASALRSKLKAACPSLAVELPQLIGRSRKQKVEIEHSYVTEQMTVGGKALQYMQVEGAFSQPNGGMCQQMLGWAHTVTLGSEGDLVELYCGNGNFTLALASNFQQVVGTEISKTSVAAAKHNISANDTENVMVGRVSAEEFSEAWKEGTKLSRLDEKDLRESYDFKTVLVDPPRAGLDESTVKLVTEFDNIVYISCNPATLAENLERICETHRVEKFAVFDQFPYTHHLECGVYLTRKAPKRALEREDGSFLAS